MARYSVSVSLLFLLTRALVAFLKIPILGNSDCRIPAIKQVVVEYSSIYF